MNNINQQLISPGARSDFLSSVNISTANRGYYSKEKPIQDFIHYGLIPLKDKLLQEFNFCDMGGGNGLLAKAVNHYFKQENYKINTVVIDANPNCIVASSKRRLFSIQLNIETCYLQGLDLITMRGVNHYNTLENQIKIYKNVFDSLNENGFFVSSICSGSAESCELKSAIANLSSLNRICDNNKIHATSLEEYTTLLSNAGFTNVRCLGYSLEEIWHPKDIWERTNNIFFQNAKTDGNQDLLARLTERRTLFFDEAEQLVKTYISDILCLALPKDRESLFKHIPNTQYPIIVAEKK